jgi:hypothetical protein
MTINRILVQGNCWNGNCKCNQLDGEDPEKVGYPPFHEGCICMVEKIGGEKNDD